MKIVAHTDLADAFRRDVSILRMVKRKRGGYFIVRGNIALDVIY